MKSLIIRSEERFWSCGLLIAVIVLLLATYLLTPRFWEPSAESWKQWAVARILRETGGFPVFSLGPLYVSYLQIFQLFDYPLSMQLEYFLTHLFAYIAIFLMLRSVLPATFALLLTCAWIPALAVLEPGGRVAGIGFIALYFRGRTLSAFNKGYFPALLLAAAFCHISYLVFLIGNAFGVFIERYRRKQPIVVPFSSIRQTQIFPLIVKAGLLMFVVLTVFLPSHRWDHNYLLVDPTYMPISVKDPLTTVFFQIAGLRYITRTVPQSLWIYQDWYFTHEIVFGQATTILQALLHKPHIVIANILQNMVGCAQLPIEFFSGRFRGPLVAVSMFLLPIGFLGMVRRFWANSFTPRIFSIIFGTSAIVGALLLTSCFNPRYYLILLPVALLIIAHIGTGLWYLVKSLLDASRKKRLLIIAGILSILAGIVFSEWILAALFSADKTLEISTRLIIRSFDILLITIGILLMILGYRPSFFIKILRRFLDKDPLYTSAIVVLVSAGCILFTASYPHGNAAQIKAVLRNRGWLSLAEPVSMTAAYPQLLAGLNGKTNVLALEDIWIKAFAKKVDLNRVYNIFSLPPFSDSSGNTERMLEEMDVIWVSPNWSKEAPSMSIQIFLRYHLHVAPFLEKAMAKGWTEQEVAGFGKVYRRPIAGGKCLKN